jgi:hypothetical protein
MPDDVPADDGDAVGEGRPDRGPASTGGGGRPRRSPSTDRSAPGAARGPRTARSGAGGTGGASAPRAAGGRGRDGRGGPGGQRSGGRPGGGASGERRAEIDKRVYDPRREERRKQARVELPEDVTAGMLDPDVRRELRSLSRDTADLVARHLVVAGRSLDEEPDVALTHARAARALAGRVGPVREAAGLAAYAAGEWAEALTELRAARRITGQPGHLAVLADCERALGRPERALALGDDPDVSALSQEERVELVMVLSGARRDLGQADAAVLLLQEPARRTRRQRPWAARLWYALADALLDAGRPEEARSWFAASAEADDAGATDADERLLELDGVVVEDLQDDVELTGDSEPSS